MDDIDDFFDFSKPFKRITVSGGHINGRVAGGKDFVDEIMKREKVDEDYAKIFVDAEKAQIFTAGPPSTASYSQSLNDLEELEESKPKIAKVDDPVFDKYNFEADLDPELPIADARMKIVNTIRENRVTVLQGDTGCGKTTQVPQYILEDAYRRRERCNIICTQPRRIAAISIANRVCSERKWEVGGVVGFQIGLHANSSEDTRLLYCTTGILLQKLIKVKDMSNYTHVILDEVHERDQDMDFLLIIVRRLLATNSPNVKVILMSATIDTKEFAEYFKLGSGGGGPGIPPPIIKVDTRRLYNVKEFFICELRKLNTNIDVNYEDPTITDDMYTLALKLIVVCEKLDDESPDPTLPHKPSILIFLPGITEIDKMDKTLLRLRDLDSDIKMVSIRLHSMISNDEQQRVFRRPPPNHRKIILSTNIAESSITVPDVKYVIDFCRTKNLVTDTSTNLTCLQLNWAARSNCRQRAGRAGRVMNGRVYRLVSKDFYYSGMEEYGSPEMIRCPLENIVLKAKMLDMGPPHAILALAMTPPNLADIRNTILVLKEAGALYKTVSGNYEAFDGDLSFIGRVMAALPIDIRISRLIIFGYIFSLLEETIIIAAGLNVKSIFEFPITDLLKAYTQKLSWSDGSGSDLFAILKAYRVWCSMKEQNNFEDEDTERSWARRYFINTRSMREMHLLVNEIKERLSSVGIKEIVGVDRVNWMEKEKTIVLKIIIAGAFYPNYFLRTSSGSADSERDAFQAVCGHDPCNTVYFSGFDGKYIGQLYVQSIKDLFKQAAIPAKNIEVRFECGSQKVFITFISDSKYEYGDSNNLVLCVPGRVRPEVYKAVKMRQIRASTIIKVMNPKDAVVYAEAKGLGIMNEGKWIPKKKEIVNPELVVIPSVSTKILRGQITHIEHCGKFWFQPLSEEERLKEIYESLNGESSDISTFHNPSEISKGMMVAAPFSESKGNQTYHRARVINLVDRYRLQVSFRVLFLDYGNFEIFDFSKLRKLGPRTERLKDLPPRVFECCLAEVQPSSINCPNGKWPDEAMEMMQELADSSICEIEVYSVVAGIVSVILKAGEGTFNDLLIEKGYAQSSDENYMSKTDHDMRMRKQKIADMYDEDDVYKNEDYLRSMHGEENVSCSPPPAEKCRTKVDLRGPFSPLEARIFAATRIGGWKSVLVEPQSVNSVLVDTDPQESHERLLVAASITENPDNNRLTARATTWMPNIHGFAPLMGLIFCPTMEIRRDKHKTKYVSILTGLGCDKNKRSYFEEHDIVFNLDVSISSHDLEVVNQIRYSMDSLLYTEPGIEMPKLLKSNRVNLAGKIKHLIIKLLEKPRKFIEIHSDNKEHLWSQVDEGDLLMCENVYGHRSLFPLHSGLRLYNQSFEVTQNLRQHCDELHRTAQFDIPINGLVCQLCEQNLETTVQLRIHLLSQLHRDREYQIGYNM